MRSIKVRKKNNLFRMLASTSYMLGVASIIAALAFGLSPAMPTFAQANTGAIWTTNNTCGAPQNINQYEVGNTIYINGSKFTPAAVLAWDITRVSGGSEKPTLASGSITVSSGGTFCIAAYQIQASDAGFTYQATVGNVKSDNFRVAAADPTATFTPTSTPTDIPIATATNTPIPTSTPTDTNEPTATYTPTSTPEDPGDPGDPGDPTDPSDPSDPTDPTPTSTPVPPTATPVNPVSSPTQTILGIDAMLDPALLIPVTGADSIGGPLSTSDLLRKLGVILLGFGLVLHGFYLRAQKLN
jgi:hypothetical protein